MQLETMIFNRVLARLDLQFSTAVTLAKLVPASQWVLIGLFAESTPSDPLATLHLWSSEMYEWVLRCIETRVLKRPMTLPGVLVDCDF